MRRRVVQSPENHRDKSEAYPTTCLLEPSDNPAMLGRVGDFDVLEVLGVGGMSVVFKGYDQQLNRWVAIKVLCSQYAASAAARRRFEREAQAAAAVVHPHVVGIHAVNANHEPPFLVMAFVPGETLQQRLDRVGPFPISEVLRIGQQISEGLAAAHEQGVVHRDIKPANILLEGNVDRVLLTDFGLALVAAEASLTQSGLVAGTPQYMSPEQAAGGPVDHRSDLFSLGSVLYALLAGHVPFRAELPLAVLRRVTDEIARPIREINASVPDWMAALIERLHAKRPTNRFQTAREVAVLLRQCLAHVEQPTVSPLPLMKRDIDHQCDDRVSMRRWAVFGIVAAVGILMWITLHQIAVTRPKSSVDQPESQPDVIVGSQTTETDLILIPAPSFDATQSAEPSSAKTSRGIAALNDEELAKLNLNGDWKIVFPFGVDDKLRFIGVGRNQWRILSSSYLAGMYRRERDKLVMETPSSSGPKEFVWNIESSDRLTLERAPKPPHVPVNPVGATLTRIPKAGQ